MTDHKHTIVAPLAAIEAELNPAAQFCLERYSAAREARYRVLGPEDIAEVAAFHERYLPLLSTEIRHRLTGNSNYINYDWSMSITLRHEGVLKAILIAYADEAINTAFVYGLAVDHQSRRSWPSVMIRYYGARHLMQCGYEAASFQALHNNPDAIRLALRALKNAPVESR